MHSDTRQSPWQRKTNELLIAGQIAQSESLPEIPDLPSLSPSRRHLPIGQESILVLQYPLRQCPDERTSPSETSPRPLRFPQTISRHSCIPSFSLASLHPQEPLHPGPTRTCVRLTGRTSEYRVANATSTNSRRSWGPGDNFLDTQLQEEDFSATMYANDILDRIFNVDNRESCFALEPFDVVQDNTSAQSSCGHTLSLRVSHSTVVKGTLAKFLHTIGKVRRAFTKLKAKDRERSAGLPGEFVSPAPHARRFRSIWAEGVGVKAARMLSGRADNLI